MSTEHMFGFMPSTGYVNCICGWRTECVGTREEAHAAWDAHRIATSARIRIYAPEDVAIIKDDSGMLIGYRVVDAARDDLAAENERLRDLLAVLGNTGVRTANESLDARLELARVTAERDQARARIAKVRELAEEWSQEERDWGIRCTDAGRQLKALLDGSDD